MQAAFLPALSSKHTLLNKFEGVPTGSKLLNYDKVWDAGQQIESPINLMFGIYRTPQEWHAEAIQCDHPIKYKGLPQAMAGQINCPGTFQEQG